MELTVGTRYDHFRTDSVLDPVTLLDLPQGKRGQNRLLPRVNLAWKATRQLSLNLSAGGAMTVAQPSFQRVCCGATVMPNSLTRPETSWNYLLDAEYLPWPWLKFRAGLFHSGFENMIQKIVWFSFPNYIPSYAQVNYQDASFEGGEFSVATRFFDRLEIQFQGSHLRARNSSSDIHFLGTTVMTLKGKRIPYLAEDQAQGSIKWDDPTAGLEINVQAQYTGSMVVQKMTRPVGSPKEFGETPAFWAYNFNAKYRVAGNLSRFAGVDNITNRIQTRLEDPRIEYNWCLLRGRYLYMGLSYEM